MNTEWTNENILTYIKTYYGEAIPAKIRKLEETMIKGALSGLRQFLATESSLKFDEKGFLLHLKSSFRS